MKEKQPTNGASVYHDAAEDPAAAVSDDPGRGPEHSQFLEKFCEAYGVKPDDRADLERWTEREVGKILSEKFRRLIAFAEECKLPRLVVFAMLCTNGEMSMVEIAKRCSVKKQAIWKEFRRMEPTFLKHAGPGFERRRRLNTSTPQPA